MLQLRLEHPHQHPLLNRRRTAISHQVDNHLTHRLDTNPRRTTTNPAVTSQAVINLKHLLTHMVEVSNRLRMEAWRHHLGNHLLLLLRNQQP
jgi:hypothetical protein